MKDIFLIDITHSPLILAIVSAGESPKDAEVGTFLQNIEKYVLASHLGWGLWGIISVI